MHPITALSLLVLVVFIGCAQNVDNATPIALDPDAELAIKTDQFMREAKLHCERSEYDETHEAVLKALACMNQSNDAVEDYVLERIAIGNQMIVVKVGQSNLQNASTEKRPYDFLVAETVDGQLKDASPMRVNYRADAKYSQVRAAAIAAANGSDGVARTLLPEESGKINFLNLKTCGLDLSRRPFFLDSKYGKVVVGVFGSLTSNFGKDISAAVQTPVGWARLGSNGFGITSHEDGYVFGLTADSEDRIWMLVRFNSIGNPDTFERWFLYCYENDRWKIKGPANGHPNKMLDGNQLLVSNTGIPIFHNADVDESHHRRPRIDYLSNGRWVEAPISKSLTSADHCFLNPSAPTEMFIVRRDKPSSTYTIHQVETLTATELGEPKKSFQSEKYVEDFVINSMGELACTVMHNEKPHVFLCKTNVSPPTIELIAPPSEMYLPGIGWDSNNNLVIGGFDQKNVYGFRRIDGNWQPAGSVQHESEVQFAKLFLSADDEPVLTWMTGFKPFGF